MLAKTGSVPTNIIRADDFIEPNKHKLRIKPDENTFSFGYLRNGAKLLLHMLIRSLLSTGVDKWFSYRHYSQL